jgi:hypothetical protein
MDKSDAIVRFEHLRDQALSLQTQPHLGPGFPQWHRDVLDTLEQAFGIVSAERREFQRIRFELDPGANNAFAQSCGNASIFASPKLLRCRKTTTINSD